MAGSYADYLSDCCGVGCDWEFVSMQITNLVQDNNQKMLVEIIKKNRLIIILIGLLFPLIGCVYALTLSEKYQSTAILITVESQSQFNLNSLGGVGNLASLAGVNLGSSSPNTEKYLQILKSADFISSFIERHNLGSHVMASIDWDETSNAFSFDEDVFDNEENTWVRKEKLPRKAIPSKYEFAEKFKQDFLKLYVDDETGFVTLQIVHFSPYAAQKWLTLLISDLNYIVKTKDKQESRASIIFLDDLLKQTDLTDARASIYSLKEEQLNRLMLAELKEEYALETIQAPTLELEKSYPNRPLILFLFIILTIVLDSFYVFTVFLLKISR
jgi:LPS O-antigen subunit length determinant protein (WzzB/FepE family)